jgi:tRNA uridine 5-carboxymethylaminomethyl modification enzyme
MFTSRAEYRLLLREDNADLRLTPIGRELGVVDDVRWAAFEAKQEAIVSEQQRMHDNWLRPAQVDAAEAERVFGGPLPREYRLEELLRRPEVSYRDLMKLAGIEGESDPIIAEQLEIQAKYAGYIDRQQEEIQRHRRLEEQKLPADLDYSAVSGLSREVCEKLNRARPESIGQAARLPGITPAAISLLLVHLKKREGRRVC